MVNINILEEQKILNKVTDIYFQKMILVSFVLVMFFYYWVS